MWDFKVGLHIFSISRQYPSNVSNLLLNLNFSIMLTPVSCNGNATIFMCKLKNSGLVKIIIIIKRRSDSHGSTVIKCCTLSYLK